MRPAPAPTHGLGWLVLAVLLAAAAGGYAISCWWFPFTHCRRCQGGRISRGDRQVFRLCRRCKGSGRRLRIGRRAWNHIQALREAS